MAQVKKSIYLDPELDAALRASAVAEGRSVTKQLDFLLRNGLGLIESHRAKAITAQTAGKRSYRPDPRVKARPKKLT